MWVIGGAMLGWFGMKSYRKYIVRNKKTKNGKQPEFEDKDFSLKGN